MAGRSEARITTPIRKDRALLALPMSAQAAGCLGAIPGDACVCAVRQ